MYIDIGKNQIIAYNNYIATNFDAPTVIFHHGFMSDMNGYKALMLEKYCRVRDINFIRYDNYGCGASSGQLHDQNLTSWIDGGKQVIKHLAEGKNIIHVGSSLGAWIAISLALELPEHIIGVINLAPAFDFTHKLILDQLTYEQKKQFERDAIFYLHKGQGEKQYSYPITLDLVLDARKYLLFNREKLEFAYPVHLIHGMQDTEVPYTLSIEFIQKLKSPGVLKLIKDAGHSLAQDSDMEILYHSIEEIISSSAKNHNIEPQAL